MREWGDRGRDEGVALPASKVGGRASQVASCEVEAREATYRETLVVKISSKEFRGSDYDYVQ